MMTDRQTLWWHSFTLADWLTDCCFCCWWWRWSLVSDIKETGRRHEMSGESATCWLLALQPTCLCHFTIRMRHNERARFSWRELCNVAHHHTTPHHGAPPCWPGFIKNFLDSPLALNTASGSTSGVIVTLSHIARWQTLCMLFNTFTHTHSSNIFVTQSYHFDKEKWDGKEQRNTERKNELYRSFTLPLHHNCQKNRPKIKLPSKKNITILTPPHRHTCSIKDMI